FLFPLISPSLLSTVPSSLYILFSSCQTLCVLKIRPRTTSYPLSYTLKSFPHIWPPHSTQSIQSVLNLQSLN
ncbi:hypothetical protein BDQ17DRAFT_1269397, partial [Cyathus striatus]